MATTDILYAVTAMDNHYSGLNYATIAYDGDVPVLKFDAATDEFAEFLVYLPDHYASGGLTVQLLATAATATSGNIEWEVAIARLQEDSTPASEAFAAVQASGAVAMPGTAGLAQYATVTFTSGAQMDSWVAGEWAKMRVNNNTGVASAITGDLELIGITIKET